MASRNSFISRGLLLNKNIVNKPALKIAFSNNATACENIKVSTVGASSNVGLIQLNHPKAFNALSYPMFLELAQAVKNFDADEKIAAVIITGNEHAFCAGGDIKAFLNETYNSNQKYDMFRNFEVISNCAIPVIAAVNGFALGGGCELATLCDIIYAGEKAKFGQTEINIGTIAGAGSTQRLPRYVSKSNAMEIILTGNFIDAQEAEKMGLVSRVFPVEELLEETIKLAERISTHSPLIVKLAKQAVYQAYETTLKSGLQYEQSLFYGTFATKDRKEGMNAFIEKRPPTFKND